MLNETLISLRDNIKRRISNPFLGTLTIVYILRNWELFYGIFNFDSNSLQKTKLDYIRNYYSSINGFWNLMECIGYKLIVLIGTYLLLTIGRFIANIYEDKVLPWVIQITDNKKIVTKEAYVILENERL